MVSSGPIEFFDNEYGPVESYEFSFEGSAARILVRFESNLDDVDESYLYLSELVAPLLDRHKLALVSVGLDLDYAGGPPWTQQMVVQSATRGRSMDSLALAAEELMALLRAVEDGHFSAATVQSLLLSGHAEALIGQHESEWLEAKSSEYPLETLGGRVALAEVVAGIANSGNEALLVIGLRTRTIGSGGEVIRDVTPLPIDPKSLRRHRSAIRNHVYPTVAGLTIQEVQAESGRIVVVHIPIQPDELKPFLVHGAVVDGRNHGAFIGISTRVVDENVPTTASMMHATLAAGRALLRPDGELTVIRRADLIELERQAHTKSQRRQVENRSRH